MRVAVIGAGALGSVFGGFLALEGHQVSLLGRQWHLDAVKENGLLIEGIWGEHLVRNLDLAVSPETLQPGFDLVLITVKAYDTLAAADMARYLMKDGGLVLSLQNGIGNGEILDRAVGRTNSALGRVIFGAEIPRPGVVKVTVCADEVELGPLGEGYPASRILVIRNTVKIMADAGIPCRYSDAVQASLWAKAIYNCALNPLGALLGVTYGELADNEHTRGIMNAVIRECIYVAQDQGVDLPWETAEDYQKEFYEQLVPPTRDHRASMLQDMERGRPTEIDALNGLMVFYGKLNNVETPVNKIITSLIKAKVELGTR